MSAAYLRGPEVAPRPERYVGCVGKHPFPTPNAARMVAAKADGFVLDVYRCKRCGRWHIGNAPQGGAQPGPARAAFIREEK